MMKRGRSSLLSSEAKWGFVLIAPMLLGLAIFFYIPLGASFYLGFTKWDVLTPPKWVGLSNYIHLFTNPLFYKTLWNTTRFALMLVPTGLVVSLILALALNNPIRFRSLYRLIYFLPVLTVPVAIAIVWQWIYNPQYGMFSQLFGLELRWLTDVKMAMPSLVIMAIWMGSGYGMVIFLAGLQNIPRTYYEAAQLDGANSWMQFRYITLPLLTPTIFFNLLTSLISAFQAFDIVYIMTQGGPLDSTRTIVYTIWEDAFHYFRMGSATAEAWILFAIILIVALIQFRSQKQWVHYA